MSFQVGKDSTDIANSKLWPFILRDPLKLHVWISGIRQEPLVGLSLSFKFNLIIFSFNGFRMRTCYARPRIVYILSWDDRLFLRKKIKKFPFQGGGSLGRRPVDSLLLFKHFRVAFFPSLKLKQKFLKSVL